jgi:hypothetical protein
MAVSRALQNHPAEVIATRRRINPPWPSKLAPAKKSAQGGGYMKSYFPERKK